MSDWELEWRLPLKARRNKQQKITAPTQLHAFQSAANNITALNTVRIPWPTSIAKSVGFQMKNFRQEAMVRDKQSGTITFPKASRTVS
jgi:hypothetical protein